MLFLSGLCFIFATHLVFTLWYNNIIEFYFFSACSLAHSLTYIHLRKLPSQVSQINGFHLNNALSLLIKVIKTFATTSLENTIFNIFLQFYRVSHQLFSIRLFKFFTHNSVKQSPVFDCYCCWLLFCEKSFWRFNHNQLKPKQGNPA